MTRIWAPPAALHTIEDWGFGCATREASSSSQSSHTNGENESGGEELESRRSNERGGEGERETRRQQRRVNNNKEEEHHRSSRGVLARSNTEARRCRCCFPLPIEPRLRHRSFPSLQAATPGLVDVATHPYHHEIRRRARSLAL